MVVGKDAAIQPQDLPLHLEGNATNPAERSLAAMEKDHIERVLNEMNGNVTRSAKVLGIDRATLYNKIKKYGLRR